MQLEYLAQSWLNVHHEWQEFLCNYCADELVAVDKKMLKLATKYTIFPKAKLILRALELAPKTIKVVILGQDPYHGENQANGLAFAVNLGLAPPPSLQNIFKELMDEYNPALIDLTHAYNLEAWARQGVMLLNCSLSVIKDRANSLADIGWHAITDKIIQHLSQVNSGCVFMLWGNFARNKKQLINQSRHLLLEAAHPSPLSAYRGFFGCNHFKRANSFLEQQQRSPIIWL